MKCIFLSLTVLFYCFQVHAACTKITSLSSSTDAAAIAAGYTASSWTGSTDTADGPMDIQHTISLSSTTSFQPSGTLLASSTASFLTGGYNTGYSANQVLFRCLLSDESAGFYEYYATNGDSTYAGSNIATEISDGNAYYTYVRNVAYKLYNIRTGEYFSRYWKRRALDKADLFYSSTYVYIPAKAFSGVTMELYKITSTTYYANSATRYTYAWPRPLGYTAFQGNGLSTNLAVGADSASYHDGWYANWPGAWGLYNSGVTFIRGATCTVSDYPSTVILPSISTTEINSGSTSQASFEISLTCESNATSGNAASSTTPQLAMGFLVNSTTAVSAAKNLGLTSGSTGLTTLLDSNYGSTGQASGVGIKLYSTQTGAAINLLSTSYTAGAGTNYTGSTNGWYGFKVLTSSTGTDDSGNVQYSGNFTASLEKISGQTVTAGAVDAQLQVLVSLQ